MLTSRQGRRRPATSRTLGRVWKALGATKEATLAGHSRPVSDHLRAAVAAPSVSGWVVLSVVSTDSLALYILDILVLGDTGFFRVILSRLRDCFVLLFEKCKFLLW